MKCKYCNEPAGMLKGYHKECCERANVAKEQIESIVNSNKNNVTVSPEIKGQMVDIVCKNVLYRNCLENSIINKRDIHTGEIILHVESMIRIVESKNRCKMVETGNRYEKMPTWSEKQLLLDKSGRIALTDKAIYLEVSGKTMRYPYGKIVNAGYDKMWKWHTVYFDVKTSSPYPHRFELRSAFEEKDGVREKKIYGFIHCLTGK